MRDVSAKVSTLRTARAVAVLKVSPSSVRAIREGTVPKGDPLPVAKVAAVMAAKNTPLLIPYCHPVPVEHVDVRIDVGEEEITVEVGVKAVYKTGVEMEALCAASAAALNLYDILKPIDDDMEIRSIALVSKTGGKSNVERPPQWSFGVIVVSDSVAKGQRTDASGQALRDGLTAEGGSCGAFVTVPDEPDGVRAAVQSAVGQGVQFVFLTGGTGLGPRDRTPEALETLFERRLPGVEEHLRAYGQQRVPTAMLSRLCAGTVGDTVVVALPGSPSAVRDAIDALFPYLLHCWPILQGAGHP